VLDLDLLRHGLDHEVDVAEAVVRRRPGDQAKCVCRLRLRLLLRDLALLDELGDLLVRHLAGLLEPRVHESLVNVLEQDGHVGGRDHLGDLAAHDAGAHDRRFEHEHDGRA
jgi:hypothetical protein